MGYRANGVGSATLKKDVEKDSLIKLLDKTIRDGSEIQYDLGSDPDEIWIQQSTSHWDEDDITNCLKVLTPFITEGEMRYNGDDDCFWRYRFDPKAEKWNDERGEVVFKTENSDALDVINKAIESESVDASAEVMSELLMDSDWSTYKMFEGLAADYIYGNDDVRKGIDLACSALTGWNLDTIAKKVLGKSAESKEDEADE